MGRIKTLFIIVTIIFVIAAIAAILYYKGVDDGHEQDYELRQHLLGKLGEMEDWSLVYGGLKLVDCTLENVNIVTLSADTAIQLYFTDYFDTSISMSEVTFYNYDWAINYEDISWLLDPYKGVAVNDFKGMSTEED